MQEWPSTAEVHELPGIEHSTTPRRTNLRLSARRYSCHHIWPSIPQEADKPAPCRLQFSQGSRREKSTSGRKGKICLPAAANAHRLAHPFSPKPVCCCCSSQQTRCAAPRVIDLDDLAHIVGYLAETSNLGIKINIRDIQPYLYVDVGHATHEDKKSHSACLISFGKLDPKNRGTSVIWRSWKQCVVEREYTWTPISTPIFVVFGSDNIWNQNLPYWNTASEDMVADYFLRPR